MLRPMATLGLDLSSPYLALGLVHNGVATRWCEDVGRDHAARVTRALDELFSRAGLTSKDLTGVTVGVGPGSYTGLRVGVAVAKGIARSLNIPLRGESTLLALAATALGTAELSVTVARAVVALDARRGDVYAGVFRLEGGVIVQEGELVKASRETLQGRGLPYFENIPPDASYLARCAALGANTLTPLYL